MIKYDGMIKSDRGTVSETKWLGLSETEWNAYIRWFSNTYGFWKSITTAGEAHRPFIEIWKGKDKPYLGVAPGEPYLTPEEKEAARLEAGVTEEVLAGEISPEDLGFPAGEDYEWVQKYDPATRSTRWIEKLVEEPVTEEDQLKELYPGLTPEQARQAALIQAGLAPVVTAPPTAPMWRPGELELLGAPPQWRPGELELQEAEFEWRKQQAELEIARSYEDWRRRLLGELTGPGDWITRWMVEQTPEKYPWSPPTGGVNQLDELESTLDEQTGVVQSLQNKLADATLAGNTEEIAKVNERLLEATTNRDTTYNAWNTMKKEKVNWSDQRPTIEEIQAQFVAGRTPPAPGWLSKFAPGQVAGRPITKEQIPTPSGQQLTQLAPSKASALGGFADWAGGRPWQDILAHAEVMLPKTPGGGARWRPISQGVA